ncbi:hypothetical protein, variant [Saprolegnia diclina VS20]|uniref:Uncharacterized protein n=1 Tax=Saprolegnia diclina (strain VS20) TaxID=1156394 RepID=T0QJN9_SAPDV|nr:hypothetical protein, variant [Saprolegnia diclina VS20]EQC33950.1 hypothetical protein, variant [Saprolegnia diclina VS20]|eukprot:XP_008612745.1 hypothetical protein, variant [Saprolegnia diclina VS20]
MGAPMMDETRAGSTPKGAKPVLVAQAPMPRFAFVDEFIECTLVIEHYDLVPKQSDGALSLPFQVALVHEDTKLTTETSSHLTIDPTTPLVFTSETCTFRFSLQHVLRNMCLRCFVPSTDCTSLSTLTSPFSIVKEKLVVSEQPPDVWFKDEGGKDKKICVQVNVQAAPGHSVIDRVIPLTLQLLYDSGEPVPNASVPSVNTAASILKLYPDLPPHITNGHVKLEFRIEDVSKNHQNHCFLLRIAPQSSNVYEDLAAVDTQPVAIRSKRNKRRLSSLKSPSNMGGMTGMSPSCQRPRMIPTPTHGATPTSNAYTPGSRRATPHNVPRPRMTWTDTMQEWKLIGYEIHGDGTTNHQAPLYRCVSCQRFSDATKTGEHAPNCGFVKHQQARRAAATPQAQMYGPYTPSNYTPQHHTQQFTPSHANMVYTPSHAAYNPATVAAAYQAAAVAAAAAYTPTNAASMSYNNMQAYTPSSQQAYTPSSSTNVNPNVNPNVNTNAVLKTENIFLQTEREPEPETREATDMMMTDLTMDGLMSTPTTETDATDWSFNTLNMAATSSAAATTSLFAGSTPPSDEQYVSLILAQMQVDMHGQKMGLPAFNQFQQLVRRVRTM